MNNKIKRSFPQIRQSDLASRLGKRAPAALYIKHNESTLYKWSCAAIISPSTAATDYLRRLTIVSLFSSVRFSCSVRSLAAAIAGSALGVLREYIASSSRSLGLCTCMQRASSLRSLPLAGRSREHQVTTLAVYTHAPPLRTPLAAVAAVPPTLLSCAPIRRHRPFPTRLHRLISISHTFILLCSYSHKVCTHVRILRGFLRFNY